MLEIVDIDHLIIKNDIPQIDHLLSQGMVVPIIFDNAFISIKVKNIELPKLLYRKLFEDVFLDRFLWSSETKAIYISLSEAMLFIKTVTPPILKDQMEESTKSLEDVMSCLKLYLLEKDSPSYNTHVSIFEDVIMYKAFDNSWQQLITDNKVNFNKSSIMINHAISKKLSHACLINYSSLSFDKIVDNDSESKDPKQGVYTIFFKDNEDSHELISTFINEITNTSYKSGIVAVGEQQDFTGFMIKLNGTPDQLQTLVKDSYSVFLKK